MDKEKINNKTKEKTKWDEKRTFDQVKVVSFVLIATVCLIIALGNLNMFGISKKLYQSEIFEKYSMVSVISVLLLLIGFFIAKSNRFSLPTLGFVLLITSMCLLILVELTGVQKYGARRWVYIGGISIHPTEIIKVPIIMIASYYIAAQKSLLIKTFIFTLIFLVPSALIIKHPDYGSAGSILFLMLLSFFISEVPLRFIIPVLTMIILSVPLVWRYGLKEYHRERILGLLDQEERAMEVAYQTVQSKIAIASGGLYGAGIGKGEHGSGQWIPNLHTDFAFASISEDLGFIGSTITIIVFATLITTLCLKSILSEDRITKSMCVLTSALIFFHAFVNIGMVSGLLPVIGIPLTLISYAGTHNISTSFLIGLCAGMEDKKKSLT